MTASAQPSSADAEPLGPDRICAVIVTFYPDADVVAAEIAACREQVQTVVVVDNSPDLPWFHPPVHGDSVVYLPQAGNVGLGAAQNAGIAHARATGHTHVLLLDQDSVPAPGMVAALSQERRRLERAAGVDGRPRVAAVGPRFRDEREDQDAPFVRVAFPMSEKLWCEPGAASVRCDFLISSGSLIPLAVLDDVGAMDDGLFIDNVDLEWSFRVRDRGYGLYGVCGAQMAHRLGDDRVRLPGGASQVVHGPVRLYFIMRNRVALYRRPHTPRVWVAQDIPRVLLKLVVFTVLVGPRRRNAAMMLRGLFDGLRGRSGPGPLAAA